MPQSKQHKTMLAGVFFGGGISTIVTLVVNSSLDKQQVVALGITGVLLFFFGAAIGGVSAPYPIGKIVKVLLLFAACIVLMLPFSWIAWARNRAHIHILGFHRVQGFAPYEANVPVQILVGVVNDGNVDGKMTMYYRARLLPHPKADVGTSLEDQFFDGAVNSRPSSFPPGEFTQISRGQEVQTIISVILRPEDISAIQSRRDSLYIGGRILYDDTDINDTSPFIGTRYTNFCIHLGAQPGEVTLCQDHREEP